MKKGIEDKRTDAVSDKRAAGGLPAEETGRAPSRAKGALVAKAAGWTVLCLALAWRFCCKVYDSMYLLGAEEKQALLEDGADVVLFGFLAFLFGLSAVAAVCSKAAFFRLLVRKPSLAKRVCADAFCFLLWCGVVFWFCIVFMIRG